MPRIHMIYDADDTCEVSVPRGHGVTIQIPDGASIDAVARALHVASEGLASSMDAFLEAAAPAGGFPQFFEPADGRWYYACPVEFTPDGEDWRERGSCRGPYSSFLDAYGANPVNGSVYRGKDYQEDPLYLGLVERASPP